MLSIPLPNNSLHLWTACFGPTAQDRVQKNAPILQHRASAGTHSRPVLSASNGTGTL